MPKLTKSEIRILKRLIHKESFETIMVETGLKMGEIRDDLTNLISYRMIEVFPDPDKNTNGNSSAFYDLDNLKDYYFRATSKGYAAINVHSDT